MIDAGVFLIFTFAAFIAAIPVLFGRDNNWFHRRRDRDPDRKG